MAIAFRKIPEGTNMTKEEAQSPITTNKDLASTGKEIIAYIKAGDQAKNQAIEHYKAAGLLLLDVVNKHPKDFTAFLTRSCVGLGRSRAYELMQMAGGSKTVKQIRADTKKRVDRHRAKNKQRPLQGPVTDERPEGISADESEGILADPLPMSERAFAEFKKAVDTSMPKMTPAIRGRALAYVKEASERLEAGAQ